MTGRIRLAHLTTVDLALVVLLGSELTAGRDAGHEVLGISAPGTWTPELQALGVPHVAVPELVRSWSPVQDLRAAIALWRLLPGLDLDVLHTHTPKAGILGRVIGRLRGVPVVVNTCHGLWAVPGDHWVKRALVYGAEGVAIRFSDAELFQNSEDPITLRAFLRGRYWRTVGNGTDLNAFRFDADERNRVRAEWGVGPDDVLVGGVGRMVAEKGLGEFAQVARRLGDRARFVWVGPIDDERAVFDHDTLEGVQLVGERRDMPAVYSAMDIFVLPSYREGFPRSAMEAAACGRTLVLTDIRGCREIGKRGVHAWFVPAGDPSALGDAMGELLDSPELCRRLGDAAYRRARENFDQQEVARRSFVAYRDAGRRKHLAWANELAMPSVGSPQE